MCRHDPCLLVFKSLYFNGKKKNQKNKNHFSQISSSPEAHGRWTEPAVMDKALGQGSGTEAVDQLVTLS